MGLLYCNPEIVLHLEMERFIDGSLSKFGGMFLVLKLLVGFLYFLC